MVGMQSLETVKNKIQIILYNSLISRGDSTKTSAHGFALELNQNDAQISRKLYFDSTFEPVTTEVLRKYVTEGMTVLDIGSNIGYYTLLFSRWVGEQGTVHAFEPDPVNYQILVRNVKRNERGRNVIPHEKAVSNSEGRETLFLNPSNAGGHSIHREKAIPGESDQELDYVQVDSVTVDNFLPDVSSDLVKIDVEGSEPLVIDGMLNQISEEEPIILFEYAPELWVQHPRAVLNTLEKVGYSFFRVSNNGLIETSVQGLLEMPESWYNILAAPRHSD